MTAWASIWRRCSIAAGDPPPRRRRRVGQTRRPSYESPTSEARWSTCSPPTTQRRRRRHRSYVAAVDHAAIATDPDVNPAVRATVMNIARSVLVGFTPALPEALCGQGGAETIETMFYSVGMARRQDPDRMLAAALYGHARRLAFEAGSIADARRFLEQRAAGRYDLLAQEAGLATGKWTVTARRTHPMELLAAGLLVVSGPLDLAEVERWIEIGRRRASAPVHGAR